jgi:hypothetical protein
MTPELGTRVRRRDALLAFLRRLDEARIHYSLGSYRDSVSVHVTASGNERWEVEFFADGSVEIERFVSVGDIETNVERLEDLFRDH